MIRIISANPASASDSMSNGAVPVNISYSSTPRL